MRAALGAALLLVCVGFALAPRPPIDNSMAAVTRTGDRLGQTYAAFTERFGDDELLVLELRASDPSALARAVLDLETQAETLAPIESVLGPSRAFGDGVELMADPELFDTDARRRLQSRLSGPLGAELALLELDPPKALILLGASAAPPASWRAVRSTLETRSLALAPEVQLSWFGTPLVNLALDEEAQRVQQVALPALIVVCVLALGWALGSLRALIALLVPIGLGLLAVEGGFGLLGGESNLIVDIAKPLGLVILLATGLHVAVAEAGWRAQLGRRAAWRAAREKAPAVLLALLTTGIGFASLGLSDVRPIRLFGLLAAAYVAVGAALILVGVPTLYGWLGPRARAREEGGRFEARLSGLVRWSERHAYSVLAGALVFVGAGAWGLAQRPVQTDPVRYFPAEHPVRAARDALASRGTPLHPVEVLVRGQAGPPSLETVDEVAVKLRAGAAPLGRLDPALVVREANFRASGRDHLDTALLGLSGAPLPLDAFTRGSSTRITLFGPQPPAAALASAAAELERQLSVDIELTGAEWVLSQAQRRLVETLFGSFVLTLLLMELVLGLALRSVRLALLAVLPNLVPVAAIGLVMAAFDIPLDLGTAMTGAVALGIAVDDTLHYLVAWRRSGTEGAVRTSGRAIVLSSFVIAAGFFALVPSAFLPTRYFALLTGTAVLAALLGDLVVLPALLVRFGAKSARTGRS